MDFDTQKMASHPLAAGLIGALVGLRFAPGITWFERVTNVATGTIFAGYVAPAAGEIFHLSTVSMQSALAFAIGMFGMSVAAAVMQGLRDIKLGEIMTGWISRGGK